MALAFTPLAAIMSDTANTDTYTGTAGTPAAGDLLICLVNATATVAVGAMSGTWTWYKLKSLAYNSGADTIYAFWAYASAATATTPVFTCIGDNASACEIYCLRVTGSSGQSTPCIRQISTAVGAEANPAIAMFGPILTGNGCISWVAENGTASGTGQFTAPTSWTTKIEAGTGTNPRHAAAESHRVSGETGSTITWTCGANPWGAMVIEFCLLGGRTMSPSGGAYSSPMTY